MVRVIHALSAETENCIRYLNRSKYPTSPKLVSIRYRPLLALSRIIFKTVSKMLIISTIVMLKYKILGILGLSSIYFSDLSGNEITSPTKNWFRGVKSVTTL